MAADPFAELVALLAAEHAGPVAPQATALVDEIRRRHGDAVQGVLFYGSCLRRSYIDEGVLDFYTVVDGYAAAYPRHFKGTVKGSLLAFSNWLLPPNVYYVDHAWQAQTLRMKYNIIAAPDFTKACRPSSLHAIIWARFCQPAALVWARDTAIRDRIAIEAAEAVLTFTSRMLALAPEITRIEDLWQFGFARTYATELRPETSDTIGSVYRAAPERYQRVAELAVAVLAQRGLLEGEARAGELDVKLDPAGQQAIVRHWGWTVPLAKSVYVARLIKSALTFGDWLPYAIWKLGRHTGVHIEPTERQRRHPLIWGWPILFRLLMSQTLR